MEDERLTNDRIWASIIIEQHKKMSALSEKSPHFSFYIENVSKNAKLFHMNFATIPDTYSRTSYDIS